MYCISSSNREQKAKKIEAVLEDSIGRRVIGFDILDLGAGSGLIGSYFNEHNSVSYADKNDFRDQNARGNFLHIKENVVQSPGSSFDIIISNMVIEHTKEPDLHLSEIFRLLKKDGICYFGAPNRLFPLEPHYKLPFIHYFNHAIEMGLLKTVNKLYALPHRVEDVYLLSYFKIKKKLDHMFVYQEYTARIIKDPERFYSEFSFFKNIPLSVITALQFVSPTNIFILKKK